MPFFRVPFQVMTGPLAEIADSSWLLMEKSALNWPGLLALYSSTSTLAGVLANASRSYVTPSAL